MEAFKVFINDCYVCTVEANDPEHAAVLAENDQRFFHQKQMQLDHGHNIEVRVYHATWHL